MLFCVSLKAPSRFSQTVCEVRWAFCKQ